MSRVAMPVGDLAVDLTRITIHVTSSRKCVTDTHATRSRDLKRRSQKGLEGEAAIKMASFSRPEEKKKGMMDDGEKVLHGRCV